MAKREIIKIDQEKCNGCGLCIPNCPEGALQLIDGKVRLISDLFCDGLGACIGHCPEGAITIEQREAERYDEKKVMVNIIKQGKNVIVAHLEHLKDHHQRQYLKQALEFLKQKKIEIPQEAVAPRSHHHADGASGCPGARVVEFTRKRTNTGDVPISKGLSELRQWPIQITLVPPSAPYLQDADLLIAADCIPFSYPDFHNQLLKGKALLIGCPKLDDAEADQQKITEIFKQNNIKSVTCAHMEVPCCFGLVHIVKEAIAASGKKIPFEEVTISIQGEKK